MAGGQGAGSSFSQKQVEAGNGEVSSALTSHPVFGMGPSMFFPLDLVQASVSPPRPSPKGTPALPSINLGFFQAGPGP